MQQVNPQTRWQTDRPLQLSTQTSQVTQTNRKSDSFWYRKRSMKHTQYSGGQLVKRVIDMDLEILGNMILWKNRLQKNTSYVLHTHRNKWTKHCKYCQYFCT